MAVMNRAKFPSDLEEGLNAHFGMEYRRHPDEWRACFEVENSRKAYEEDVLNFGFGAAPIKAEGAPVSYDEGGEGWTARYHHDTVALAFAITEEAIEDNLYQSLGPKYSRALARSLKHTKEIKGANIFNNAFDSGYPGGDGKELIATDHPTIDGRLFSNKLEPAADFAEASLETILIQIRKTTDDRNIPIALRAKDIVVPPETEYDVVRVLGSPLSTAGGVPAGAAGAPDVNDINAVVEMGIFGRRPVVVTRLVDPDAWYVTTDCPEGLKHFVRVPVSRGMEDDFETGNARYKSRERYSFGWSDPRTVFGSEGAT